MKRSYFKAHFLLLALAGVAFSCSKTANTYESEREGVSVNLVELVNPLMGTDSEFKLSNGNTYPAIARPWGMNFWTPQTAKMGDGWTYAYDAYTIRGFKQTHQPSPWINDYAAFSLMPIAGKLEINEEKRASWFSHKAETAMPHYYSVYLADYDIKTEITPTDRAAYFRFTFPEADEAYILLDAFDMGSSVTVISDEQKIIGYCTNNHGGVPDNFKNYFIIQFDKPFEVSYTWKDSTLKDHPTATGEHTGAVIGFKTKRGEVVHAKVASSFISPEQAALNLEREVGSKTFDAIKEEGQQIWNKELGRIKVKGGTTDQQKTFYSCLYRTLLFPRKFYEFNENDEIVHYSPYNGEVLPGYMYTDNGFWDTFRAVFPFFTVMYPEMNSQIMQGLVNTYKESGWLPEWASPGHRDCMIGSNSASLIADSYIKGIRDYDIETLYEAILKNTEKEHPDIKSVGRYGATYYNQLGYVPYDVGINENTARTLEYAYADFCTWQLAKVLERPQEEIDLFAQRAQNFRNVFDPESNLMRGKNKDGSFQSPFNPLKWGDAFTEGNSLHYTWSVFQDIQGLVDLMGGREAFVGMLDTVFSMPPDFDNSYYGFTIHEIREMQIANMGNYAHGNQPIQHMIYLYNYAGAPWKAQKHVRNVMDRLYSPQPDGYCGDEDNGQTSAWYVFSAMGFYPVTPGYPSYVIGSPLFREVELQLENGNTFTIKAAQNNRDNVFISSASLNGNTLEKPWITHEDILNGGVLSFQMSVQPNKHWGTGIESRPPSMSEPQYVKKEQ
ncbi:Alpha-1,2-mannosidase [Fulvivirga imtechensis AK7]|uniref:Alpha-1,2-mannosidase n=1 Tax=Fulvivirga imtechensis AK7 TaxID=1237149 RepID=L8JVC0_9BACT|nr:GH92 family glycosyl hydrolase [Fulvivirga imtechensis]ELR72143.1 Alpha-1,2-mannosidase [Fulvivirga imtechensis AK7]